MDKMKPVVMKSSSGRSRRDVETAIMETDTRTELSVEYSVPSVNMNVQTDELEIFSETVCETNKSLDRTHVNKILQKLYLARRILNPVIDEIITTASTISETELTIATNTPLCSLSKQEYRGAVRASQIFKEVNDELIRKYKKVPLIASKNFRFPTSKTIVNMVTVPNKCQNKSILEVADRIYIDKELMLQLIDLYEILGETIRKLREKEHSQQNKSIGQMQPLASSSFHSANSGTSDDNMHTARSVIEPEPKKSCASRSAGSTASRKTVGKPPEDKASETKTFGSVEEAKAQATKCLQTLANVQQYFERNQRDNELDLTNKFHLVDLPEKDTCGKKAEPHIHAFLNGIPVILTLGGSKNQAEVIVVSSSTDLLIKSNKSTNKKVTQDSNSQCSSVQNKKVVTTCSTSTAPTLPPPKPSFQCPCHQNGTKMCTCAKKKANTTKSQQYVKADVNDDAACQIAISETSLYSCKSLPSGVSSRSDSSLGSALSKKKVRVKPGEKESIDGNSSITPALSAISKSTDASSMSGKSSSEITISNKGRKGIAATVSSSESCICESGSRLPYTVSKNSMPKAKSSTQKSFKSFRITDLFKVSKPAKCCRKSCLNEQAKPATPYPVSLMSLHLDDNDIDMINKKIRVCSNEPSNDHLKPIYTCLQEQLRFPRRFPVERRVFQVMYFQVKINKAVQNDPVDLVQYVYPNGVQPYKETKDFSQLFKPKKSRGINPFPPTPIYDTLFHFKGPTFEIIQRNPRRGEGSRLPLLSNKTNACNKSETIDEKTKTTQVDINMSSFVCESCEDSKTTPSPTVKDVACNCENLLGERKCPCVDRCTQYEKCEKVQGSFNAILEDIDNIPSVLYDKEGNMYLIEVASSKMSNKVSATEDIKVVQKSEGVNVHFSTGIQCNHSDLIASCSFASDNCGRDSSDLYFIRDRALKDVKRVLGSMENLSKSVYNMFAMYNFCSNPFSQNRGPCEGVHVTEEAESHDVYSADSLSNSFTKCCFQEMCRYYKKDT